MSSDQSTLFTSYDEPKPRRLNAKQASAYLGVSLNAISRLYAAGRLRGEFIRQVWTTTVAELERAKEREAPLIEAERRHCASYPPEYIQFDLDWDG